MVETIQKRPHKDAQIGVNGTITTDSSFRKSNIRFVNKGDAELGYMFDELWKNAIVANNDWFNFHISKLDYLQFAEYDAAIRGEYKTHHDVFYMNNDPVYHRKLSCVVQLSDPKTYKGGDLELMEVDTHPNKEEMRQQGTVIFFPSFVRHAALPVTEGKRHSIAAWFDGPKWR
jgi:PKHD-type hydroxylase